MFWSVLRTFDGQLLVRAGDVHDELGPERAGAEVAAGPDEEDVERPAGLVVGCWARRRLGETTCADAPESKIAPPAMCGT